MSDAPAIVVVGAGGHARVLLDALACRGIVVAGLTDPDPSLAGRVLDGIGVLGRDEILEGYPPGSTVLVNALGSTSTMAPRRALFERLKSRGYEFLTVLHPAAVVSRGAVLGEGVQAMAGVIVQPGARVGANCILNTGAQVDHDCVVGAHSHIAPGATLSGCVSIGEDTHVGTGAIVVQGVRVGAGCLVAAGSVVTRNVDDGGRVAGVPARRMRT